MVIYWHENRADITFHADLGIPGGSQKIIDSLHLEACNQFLNMRGFNLKSFTLDDVPRSLQQQTPPLSRKKKEEEPPINSQTGKYLFPSPSDQGTVVFGFFHVEQSTMAYSMSTRGSMNRSGGSIYGDEAPDNEPHPVDLINRNLVTLRQRKIPVVAAT